MNSNHKDTQFRDRDPLLVGGMHCGSCCCPYFLLRSLLRYVLDFILRDILGRYLIATHQYDKHGIN